MRRYYPGVDISDEISTESDRVNFLQSVANVMLTKARMKLNIKRLYSADGVAVKELLKVAALLYQATEKASFQDEVRQRSHHHPLCAPACTRASCALLRALQWPPTAACCATMHRTRLRPRTSRPC